MAAMLESSTKQTSFSMFVKWSLGILLVVLFSSHGYGDEQDDLQQFLNRLALKQLQITHLELRMENESNERTQLEMAKSLADLYVKRLLDLNDSSKDQFQQLIDRVNQLLLNYPETDSVSIRVLLLQAEYVQAEKSINSWLEDRRETDSLISASSAFESIAKRFGNYRRSISLQVEKLTNVSREFAEGRRRTAKENEIEQLSRVLARATYFCGWSNYYSGIAQRDLSAAQDTFKTSRECFAELLGIDIKADFEEELDPSWLGLSNKLMAQALVGMGLCEAALDNKARHTLCFKVLEDSSVAFSVAQDVPTWELQSYLNVDRFAEADLLARSLLEKESPVSDQARATICVSLIRTGYSVAADASVTPTIAKMAKQLGQIGLRELVRLRRFTFIDKLASKYEIDTRGSDFYLTWLTGYRAYMKAESSQRKQDFRAAQTELEKAISMPSASSDLLSLALARTQLGWCKFRLEMFEQSAKLFQQAIPTLKKSEKETAIKAAWMHYESYNQLPKRKGDSPEGRRFLDMAKQSLQELIRDFPGSQTAKNAEYQLTRLRRSSKTPAETVLELRNLEKSNPNYHSALYEICLLQQQIWWGSRKDPKKFAQYTTELYADCNRFLENSQTESPERRLRILMIAADASLRQNPSDTAKASGFLDRASKIATSIDNKTNLIEFRFQQFQLAQKTGKSQAAINHARWLMSFGNGSPYQKSAVITLARDIDQKVKNASAADKKIQVREAISIYSDMVKLFGDSEEVLTKSKNSRVAVSKLAGYHFQLGEYSEASSYLDRLSAAVPKDKNILQRSARANYLSRNYSDSLPKWRRLLKASKDGTEDWYEAKYHVIDCLVKTKDSSTKLVFEQFQRLHPDLPDPWKEKFNKLKQVIK